MWGGLKEKTGNNYLASTSVGYTAQGVLHSVAHQTLTGRLLATTAMQSINSEVLNLKVFSHHEPLSRPRGQMIHESGGGKLYRLRGNSLIRQINDQPSSLVQDPCGEVKFMQHFNASVVCVVMFFGAN